MKSTQSIDSLLILNVPKFTSVAYLKDDVSESSESTPPVSKRSNHWDKERNKINEDASLLLEMTSSSKVDSEFPFTEDVVTKDVDAVVGAFQTQGTSSEFEIIDLTDESAGKTPRLHNEESLYPIPGAEKKIVDVKIADVDMEIAVLNGSL